MHNPAAHIHNALIWLSPFFSISDKDTQLMQILIPIHYHKLSQEASFEAQARLCIQTGYQK
jgi:hypothetical protein